MLAATARVQEQLRGVSPGEDRWSVLHVLEHVARVDLMIAGLLRRMLARAPLVGDTGATGDTSDGSDGSDMLYTADTVGEVAALMSSARVAPEVMLDRSRRVNAVPGSEPVGGMSYEEVERMLTAARAELLETIARAHGHDLDSTTSPHPLLGPLSIRQWIRFAGLHDARHTAQIDEIRTQLEATP